jgi:hypothetical protein
MLGTSAMMLCLAAMSGEIGKIYIDARRPATLLDGGNSLEFATLGGAVTAWHNLPEEQKSAARIQCGGRVFTGAEIDRLHHRPTG